MKCNDKLNECKENSIGRGFNSIEVVYPTNVKSPEKITIRKLLTSERIISVRGILPGGATDLEEIGSVSVPLGSFYPDEISIFRNDDYQNFIKRNGELRNPKVLTIAKINIEAVGLRDYKETKNVIDSSLISVLQKFFKEDKLDIPYYISIRSPTLLISTFGRFDNYGYFGKPIEITIRYNPLNEGKINVDELQKLICLGEVIKNSWRCASRKIVEISPKPNDAKRPADALYWITYNIPGPGTFAVIFSPLKVTY